MPSKGIFSGGFDVPVGSLTLFNKDDENILDPDNPLFEGTIDPNVIIGTDINWARVNAAGTIIGSSGVSSVSRQGEGWYRVNVTTAATSSSDIGATVTPATTVGNGGDGISPYKAYDSYQVVQTDATANIAFYYNEATAEFIAYGEDSDDLWIHDETNFTGTPTQVDASADPIRVRPYGGVLSKEGGYAWMSGDGAYPVRVMDTSTHTVTDIGSNADRIVIAAEDDSGSPHIYCMDNTSTLARYSPSIGGGTIGSADWSIALDVSGNAVPAVWDNEGYLWIAQASKLYQIESATGDYVGHDYPQDMLGASTANLGGISRVAFDQNRRRIYAILGEPAATAWLCEFITWSTETPYANSGTWRMLATFENGSASGLCISYDATSDVLFLADRGLGVVKRMIGDPKVVLDTVSVDDSTPDNAQIDYDLDSSYTIHYDGDGYGYVSGLKSGVYYLIKISYQGDPIGFGGGPAIVSSVLVPQYQVIDSDTVDVYLYRTLSPPQRADGEFTIHITKT